VARERSPADRGRGFGRAHVDAVATTVEAYRRLLWETAGDLAPHGARVASAVGAGWPELVDEIEGIAAGAGQDPFELLAINARTELMSPIAATECSSIGLLRGDGVSLAQNWDWHPDLAPARVLVTTAPPDAPWFATMTEAGILAKLGLNERGLACALNFLECSVDGGVDGVPIHVLLRVLLERCRTSADALELLLRAQVSASSCVTIAASEPGAAILFAVELSPGGSHVVQADEDGLLIHTNHFLARPPQGVDTQPGLHPGTLLRRSHLERIVRAGADPERALGEHLPLEGPVCRHADPEDDWSERRETLVSIALDPGAPALRIAAGPPCRTPYRDVSLP
jgi:isopenicillin-N N-acyltransferase like protein